MDIDKKIKENQNIIWQVINDLQYIPDYIDVEDLFQIGQISLWKAIMSYDEDGKYAFSTHCYTNIKGDLLNYLRDEKVEQSKKDKVTEKYEESFEDKIIDSMLIQEIKKILNDEEFEIFYDLYISNDNNKDIAEKKYNTHRSTLYRKGVIVKDKVKRKIHWD